MQQRLLTLHCLSPLHCGSGQGIAGIDLPVQRERHTDWPLIPGSSIKGVLRDAFRASLGGDAKEADKDAKTIALFGPPSGAEELGLGALILGDALLVAFPVRSLCGVFALCTCPLALARLGRLPGAPAFSELTIKPQQIRCDQSLCAQEQKVVLEDHTVERAGELPADLGKALTDLLPPQAAFLAAHLALIPDDLFSWFARQATQVEARIALDPASKTVKDGQLFYEETVPPESVFVAPVAAEDARHQQADKGLRVAAAALAALKELADGKTLQFGGKATIGRGLCALRLSGKEV
jgi:CRISPR-associated protein Cmr4